MLKTSLMMIGALLFASCSQESPTPPIRTSEKVAAEPADSNNSTGGETGEPDAAAGLVAYDQKCLSCHQAADSSQKQGATADRIVGAEGVPSHSGVSPWPDAAEAADIAAAIAE